MQLAKGMPYPPTVSRPGLTQRWLPLGTLLAFPAEGDHRRRAHGDPVPRDFSVDGFPPRGELLEEPLHDQHLARPGDELLSDGRLG